MNLVIACPFVSLSFVNQSDFCHGLLESKGGSFSYIIPVKTVERNIIFALKSCPF